MITILTINGGSSSIKFALYRATEPLKALWQGMIKGIGLPEASFIFTAKGKVPSAKRMAIPHHEAAAKVLMDWLSDRLDQTGLAAVGHRMVHGGHLYNEPQLFTSELAEELCRLSPFDPEHLPQEIGLAEEIRSRYPELIQVACFDTAFHYDLPRRASLLAIPRRYEAQGVRRYGFHGLSYAFLLEELNHRLGTKSQGRIILAHLGSGASLAAVCGGRPWDTSMAFTPAAGIPMGTRSGDLDPGLVWYLAKSEGMEVREFNQMVNFQSGLLGISETTSDMEELLSWEAHDKRAAEAVEIFCYQVKKWVGAFAAALGGLDILVFSGGIGEKSPAIRRRICDGLEFLGIRLEEGANEGNCEVISSSSSPVSVMAIKTNEELMIARYTHRFLQQMDRGAKQAKSGSR